MRADFLSEDESDKQDEDDLFDHFYLFIKLKWLQQFIENIGSFANGRLIIDNKLFWINE